jgi:hypothetical protein
MADLITDWIVRWNVKLYDTRTRYEQGLLGPVTINQSKGRARMRDLPTEGDTVIIAWKGRAWMRGVVKQGFVNGVLHQTDDQNRGDDRPHAEPERFAVLELTSLQEPVQVRFTGQRTWVRYH